MAFDMFLKIDGIDGGSQSDKFIKWITLESFSWGVNQAFAPNADGVAEGKAQAKSLDVVGPVQISSPKLMLACATGTHFAKVQLVVIASGRGRSSQPFLKFELEDVLVSSYDIGGGANLNQLPQDRFSLNFIKFTESFSPQKPDGTLDAETKTGFDFRNFLKS